MKQWLMISIMLASVISKGVIGENRILSEISDKTTKWQFRQFSTSVEQNMETVVLPNSQILFVQSQIDEQGIKKIILQKYLRDSTKLGEALILGSSDYQCSRPKVILIDNVGFALGWMGTQMDQTYFFIQIFSFELIAITQSRMIGAVHLEVHWDFVSEFHYLKLISGSKLQLFYKPPNVEKTWTGTVFNYQEDTLTTPVSLPFSKTLEIAINKIGTIVVLQIKRNTCENRFTIMNIHGLITRTEVLTQQYNDVKTQRKIIALSNNNFLLLSNSDWSSLFIYDSRFSIILNTNQNNFQFSDQEIITSTWEYQNYFFGGLIQLQALEETFVIAGVDINSFKFRIIHLKNNLEFIQFREIHYENINIYKYFVQQTDDNTIFVQWIDGLPETLLPEYKQTLYQSELDLQLSINNCSPNCVQCLSKQTCFQCSNNYNLVNNKCEPQCIENCRSCSNTETCQICNEGYFFDNQLKCIKDSDRIQEIRISISDTTNKGSSKFKILENRNIVIVYREQASEEQLLQIKLLDQYGVQIQNQQLIITRLLNYDLIVQGSQIYLYALTQTIDNLSQIILYQYSTENLSLLQQISLPQLQNSDYFQIDKFFTQSNFFKVVQFSQTFTIVLSGFQDEKYQRIVSFTYDYLCNLLNNYFYGDAYIGNLLHYYPKQFDVMSYDNLMYIVIARQCDLQLTVTDGLGGIIRQDNIRPINKCQYFTNPSISRTSSSQDIFIAIQDAGRQILIFSWFNYEEVFKIKSTSQIAFQPQIVALDSNSFILLYQISDLDCNFVAINYLHYYQGKVQDQKIINSISIQPKDVAFATYYENDYIFISWTGFKNQMEISNNQIYLQQISVRDDKIVGLVKFCGLNCLDCEDYNKCITCNQGFKLSDQQQCRMICTNNCYQCQDSIHCKICSVGFQITSLGECTQSDKDLIAKLQENENRFEMNQDIVVDSNGNIIITWVSYSKNGTRNNGYVKIFDKNGDQLNFYKIDVCSILQLKLAIMNEKSVLVAYCVEYSVLVAFLNDIVDNTFRWRGYLWLDLFNSIPTNNQLEVAANNANQIFIIASNSSQLYVSRLSYDPFYDSFRQEFGEYRYYPDLSIRKLKISVTSDLIYYSFTYTSYQIENGINQLHTKNLKGDYNFNEIQNESFNFERLQVNLQNHNILKVMMLKTELQLEITTGGLQLFQTAIKTKMNLQMFDVQQFQHGFILIWTQQDENQDQQITLNAQIFFNNGTKITDVKQLPTFSFYPSNPRVKSLKNGEFIVVWNDIDSTGPSLFSARYDGHLIQIPFSSVICQENCQLCLSSASCQRCFEGYYLDEQKCKPNCFLGCSQCALPLLCEICSKGYHLEYNSCWPNSQRVEEEIVASIFDFQKTRVSITSFSDTSFVVAWNDNLQGLQSIFFQFYDNERKPLLDIQTLQGENDRTYAQVKSLFDDKLALVWFDGDCSVQCRLILQIFDKQLNEYTSENIIALITLPHINNQQPIQIQRQENKLIIAYLSYENSQTTAYYTVYLIDSLTLLTPIQLETSDVKIDNLDIIVYNSDIYYILYVVNSVQLKAMGSHKGEKSNHIVYSGLNIIETPTHTLNEQTGSIVIAWSEKKYYANRFINQIIYMQVDSAISQITTPQETGLYNQYQEMPQIIVQNSTQIILIVKGSYDQDKIDQSIFFYILQKDSTQLNTISYKHQFFQIEKIKQQEIILVDVGLDYQQQSKIFIQRLNMTGHSLSMADIVCPKNCLVCYNNYSCQQCTEGYFWKDFACVKQCSQNVIFCAEDLFICANGYEMTPNYECLPENSNLTQKLINTNQFSSQELQNIATLSNYYSVVVWQSSQQNSNGVSIYMQKFDPQFIKVGPETLITKDSIGVQQAPNIVALPNNSFIIIWTDSRDDSKRILMQKFSFDFERIGNEKIVYDYATLNQLQDVFIFVYDRTDYKLEVLHNGNLAILLQLIYCQENGQYISDLKLKLFDQNLKEYHDQLIGQSLDWQKSQITSVNNNFYIIWINKSAQLSILALNNEGNIVNGKIISGNRLTSLAISKTEMGQLVIGYVDSAIQSSFYRLTIQRYDQQLESVGRSWIFDDLQNQTNYYGFIQHCNIVELQLTQIKGGMIATILTYEETPWRYFHAIYVFMFDNELNHYKSLKKINDYIGNIANIKSSSIGNGDFVITWEQFLEVPNSLENRSERDSNSWGLYVKRFNSDGSTLPITNLVCQTYCNQCSKDNLCESCQSGYQFDSTKSICQLPCPDNCQICYNDQNWPQCAYCKDGFVINGNRECQKIEDVIGSNLFNFDEEPYWITNSYYQIFDQVTLQNGNIVVFYYKDSCEQMFFKIIDNQGAIYLNEQFVWTSYNHYCALFRATALSSGNFAIVFRSFYLNYSNDIYLYVYDMDGVLIRNQIILSYSLWNYYYCWDCASSNLYLLTIKQLAHGGFIIIYMSDNDGQYYLKPQLYLRVYNSEYYQISNDIQLKSITSSFQDYPWFWEWQWQWWNKNHNLISIVESESYLFVLYSQVQYYWWSQNSNKMQLIKIDKSDYSQTRKLLDIDRNSQAWWHENFINFYLWQTEENKFVFLIPYPIGLKAFFFDSQFKIISEKTVLISDLKLINQYGGYPDRCQGCCWDCWNQQLIQIISMDNSFLVLYYQQECNIYQCFNIVKMMPFSFNLEIIGGPKEIQFVVENQFIQFHKTVIRKYVNNDVVMMSVFNMYGRYHFALDKFDYKGNKLKNWQLCPLGCRNCLNQNNQLKCLDCLEKYFMDYDYTCRLICNFEHCLSCNPSITRTQYCILCEDGYQLKDNYYCIEQNQNQITEQKLQQSFNDLESVPKVKILRDGSIVVVSLKIIDEKYVIHGQFLSNNGLNIGDLIELQQSVLIKNFDFSISHSNEILLVWTDKIDNIIIRAQKYDSNFKPIGNQIIIFEYVYFWHDQKYAVVEFLQDNSLVLLLYGGRCLFMNKYDQDLNKLIDLYSFGCNWDIDQIKIEWVDYYNYLDQQYSHRAPQIVTSSDYFVILFKNNQDNKFQLRTFDYTGVLQYSTTMGEGYPTQPSLTFLENGKLALVWKDYLQSYPPLYSSEVPFYQQQTLIYVITDPQFSFTQYNYIGMDYVNEEKPDIQSIPNGFAISWSGTSEKHSQYIDLRIAYFDLYGSQQTGIISVSSICTSPTNSQISSLRDGSIAVSWFQNEWIYIQKLDSNGLKQKIDAIICAKSCSRCASQNTCEICQNGYQLNSFNQCEEICLIENCASCSYWATHCRLCKNQYFLDEQLQKCNPIVQQNSIYDKLLQVSNVQSTVVITNSIGDLIHIWIDNDENGAKLLGESFTIDGSLIISNFIITLLGNNNYQLQANYNKQFNMIILMLVNQNSVFIMKLDDSLELIGDNISLVEFFKTEFPIGFQSAGFKLENYIEGFAILANGNQKKVLNQFGLNPQIAICDVLEILLFDLNGKIVIPGITFWSNDRLGNGFLDSNNGCYRWELKDVLLEDQIYVILSNIDDRAQMYIQIYDYNGQKIRERRLSDFLIWDQWWKSATFIRNQFGEFNILGSNSQLITINSQLDLLSIENLGFKYDNEIKLIYLGSQYLLAVSKQQQYSVKRYKLWVYDIKTRLIVKSDFISQSTVYQDSFTFISQNYGNIMFSWQETGQNTINLGSQYIVRFDYLGSQIKFEQFSCLPNCSQCKVANKCEICSDNYHLDQTSICIPNCSDNCRGCSIPLTCDVCNYGYYSDDYLQCQSKEGQPSEKPISSQTSSSQIHVRVAQFRDGSSVMVWQSDTQDGSGFGVYAQKFDSAGNKKGDEIRVNINVKGQQYFPDVTTLSNGNIIIIWVDGDIETQAELFYQQFDNDLKRIGSPVFIDYITVSWITYLDVPCVVQSLIGKQFAVIWITFDTTGQQITFVTVIDGNGVKINTTPLYNYDSNKEIVVSSNGFTFVVIYRQNGIIQGSIFYVNGVYQNTVPITTTTASSPGVTVDRSGQYIIAWQADGKIFYQIFEGTSLQGLGQPFTVQIIDGVFSDNPDIVAQNNGFVIVWQNRDLIGKRSRKIRIQLFDENGVSLGNSIEVDIDSIYGEYPQLSLLNNDEFVVVWSAQNLDSKIDEGSGIYMTKFSSNGLKLSLGGITCPNRCQNCSNQDTCLKCSEDFILISGVCVPQCADNCGSCSTPLFCDICSDGYKLDPSGYCSQITPEILQEAPLLATPLLSLPSFSSSIQIIDGVIVYSGSVINIGISYYLEVNLQMIAGDNSNQFIYKIPIASTTTNIIHSDVIIREDKSIQIYWVEVIREVIRIKVITVSYVLEIIEEETIIDTIWITDSDTIHDESRVYLYYQNSQYYVIHSVYSSSYNYDVYQHQISTQYVRLTQPVHIMVTTRQISYTQILFSIDQVVFLEYTETYILRTYKFSINFESMELRETNFNFGFSNYANSFMLRRLKSGGYVVCWRSYTTWSLSSRSYIYYTMFNDNLERVSDNYVISQSNGVLGDPLIIVQEDRFAVIWNTQISITYSQLSISYYTNYGAFISTTTQLNTISNNIQYYYATVTINQEIIIIWISRITIELTPQYQYYIVKLSLDGKLMASPSLVCLSKCSTCNNQYTCLTCATGYYNDSDTKDCLPNCPASCKSCSIPTACEVCNDGYTLNTITNLCQKNPCNEGCLSCNLKQECHTCQKNYFINIEDMRYCIPTCPLHCAKCSVVPICDWCETSFYWSEKNLECVDFEMAIWEHPRKNPLRATFPTKDYVEMWIQEEPLPGIYFQLYKADGTLIGGPTKVNMDSGNRRLLQTDIQQKNFFSDLATFQNEFIVLWVDQTMGDLKVKFKKYNTDGKALSEEITIRELPKQRLEEMAAPCQIQKAKNDNFIVGFVQRIEDKMQTAATMFIQSFNKNMEPLGILQSLDNIDYQKAAMISASEDGRISITFSSNGYVYLTQISMEGNYLYEPMKVADGKAFKSTNLKNNKIVFVFEAVSTNTSPPQYVLEFEIMDTDKHLSDPVVITSPQSGEEHPFVTTIAFDFIVVWRTVDTTLRSQEICFQLFDEFGIAKSKQIKVDKQGLEPQNPSVQILNEDEFYITWTGKSFNQTDGFYTQAFKRSTLLKDGPNNGGQDQNLTNTSTCNLNCILCENLNKCNICTNGYYEENGQCEIDCGNYCSKCSKPFECDICFEGYYINQSNSCEIIDCEQGYQLNENFECVPACSENCKICESFNVCLTCQDSYQLIRGKCENKIFHLQQPEETFSFIQILAYTIGSIIISGGLMLIIWFVKKKSTKQQSQLAQPQQVIDERQESNLNSTSSRV